MDLRPALDRNRLFRLCFFVLLAAAFCVYAYYRRRFIGACDWYGYFQLGRLFGEGRVFLDTPLPADIYPSIVPLGFSTNAAHVLPQYPPGYPLLLGIASWFGAELFVTPVVGLVSIALIYHTAREFAERWISLAVAAIWAFFPIVIFGSTEVMSDLVAAVPLLGSYLLYRKGWLRTSALVLGTAFWVRPTNVLYAVVFAGVLLRDRQLIRYVLWTVPTVALYAAYNTLLFGAPWNTGYGNFANDLSTRVFWPFLGFYLWQTTLHLAALAPFVLIGLRRGRRSEVVFLAAWAAAYLLFYCFWISGGDMWWWTRFLLPGYPALFLLAANGLQQTADWIRRWRDTAAVRHASFAALGALVAGMLIFEISLGQSFSHTGLWTPNKGRDYYDVVRTVDALAPAGSFIGSVEFCGTHRLYSRNQPFVACHTNAPTLVHDLLARQVPVFLIVEPWNRTNETVRTMLATNTAELLREIEIWGGVRIYRLTPKPAQG